MKLPVLLVCLMLNQKWTVKKFNTLLESKLLGSFTICYFIDLMKFVSVVDALLFLYESTCYQKQLWKIVLHEKSLYGRWGFWFLLCFLYMSINKNNNFSILFSFRFLKVPSKLCLKFSEEIRFCEENHTTVEVTKWKWK